MLLRFVEPHSSGFVQKWFDAVLARLPEELPPYEARIISFHDYITLLFADAASADIAGRILRQARPHLVLPGDSCTERVTVIRDRPPEIRRRNLGFHHVWTAINETKAGKERAIKPLHRTRGAHKHTKFHLLNEATDVSQYIATIGWADNEQGFRVTSIEVADNAPQDVRDALAQLSLSPPGDASAPPAETQIDEEMAPGGPSA